jgi:hypothetical protein
MSPHLLRTIDRIDLILMHRHRETPVYPRHETDMRNHIFRVKSDQLVEILQV